MLGIMNKFGSLGQTASKGKNKEENEAAQLVKTKLNLSSGRCGETMRIRERRTWFVGRSRLRYSRCCRFDRHRSRLIWSKGTGQAKMIQ